MPPFSPKLLSIVAALDAKNEFVAAATITLIGLEPGKPGDQWKIDRASSWCISKGRRGHIRRRVFAADHRVSWEFEHLLDAIAFKLRFAPK